MQCPNCGNLEKSRVRVCPACGTVYASQDLLELRQLEYLLGETAPWPGVEAFRQPYAEQMESLRSRLLGPKTTQPSVAEAPQLVVETPLVQPTLPAPPPASPPPLPPPAVIAEKPKKEALPFDQWLLSERNIKFALYSGGLLLVIAGLIFVGVNWRWLSGPIKFVITTSITGLMYLGGVLLFRRPFLRMGGVALLAVACGFFPLNFAVLQIYVAGARGMEDHLMWLIGSLSALLLYFLTSYWTRADLFTYFSLAALTSAATASMVLLDLTPTAYPLVYALLALACLLIARRLRSTSASDFTYLPLLITSQLAIPVLFASAALLWVAGLDDAGFGSPWLALAAMGVCALFYLATDLAFGWIFARWAAVGAFGFTSILILIELDLSPTLSGLVLITLALTFLLGGYALQRRLEQIKDGLPLYAAGYALAAFVTLQALAVFGKQPVLLAQALLFDVLVLAVSARLHRQYGWVYGAVWLFLMPAAIYADVYLHSNSGIGIVLGVLLLVYAAAGYWLGRRAISAGLPFLSAASFLSLVVVPLVWTVPALASLMLATLAALYLLFALWLRASWLLLPALTAAHLLVISIFDITFALASSWEQSLTLVYAALGVALSLGCYWLQRQDKLGWVWPLLAFALLDLGATFLSGLVLGGWMAIGLSAAYATLAFWLAWAEREMRIVSKLAPMFSYLGIALVFIGHFYLIAFTELARIYWPSYTAGLSALFIALTWLTARRAEAHLRRSPAPQRRSPDAHPPAGGSGGIQPWAVDFFHIPRERDRDRQRCPAGDHLRHRGSDLLDRRRHPAQLAHGLSGRRRSRGGHLVCARTAGAGPNHSLCRARGSPRPGRLLAATPGQDAPGVAASGVCCVGSGSNLPQRSGFRRVDGDRALRGLRRAGFLARLGGKESERWVKARACIHLLRSGACVHRTLLCACHCENCLDRLVTLHRRALCSAGGALLADAAR